MTARARTRMVYSIAEAAQLLGIGRSTAYDLVARGELATVRIGGRSVVTRPTLASLLGVEPPLPGQLEELRPTPLATAAGDAVDTAAGTAPLPSPNATAAALRTQPSVVSSFVQPSLPFGR